MKKILIAFIVFISYSIEAQIHLIETPLSITIADNPIYACVELCECVVFTTESGELKITGKQIILMPGDLLRFIECEDDTKDNFYRWGDGSEVLIIPDFKMNHISGKIRPLG